jgi:crotonobetainyl-CoA:carnitine CoA-transferase CaiB-like acyl-CoA transferase
VIKIERPNVGDDSRNYGPPFLKDDRGGRTGESAFYLAANRNKQSVTVDLSTLEGQDIVRRIALKSDVVIENFRVGALAKFGLDYASLAALNPQLVYLSITGYGQTGDMAHRPGYDAIFQAVGGHMAVTGAPDELAGGGPMRSGLSLVDILTSLYASIAVLGALNHRDRQPDRKGQYIDVALLDSMVAALSHRGMQYLISGKASPRRGNVGAGGSPSGAFRCADGTIVLTVGNDSQWLRFCSAIEHPELSADRQFATAVKRIENREILSPTLEAMFLGRDRAHWLALLEAADIPCGPVNELDEVFADTQVRQRGMTVPVAHPLSAALTLIANPIHYSGTPLKRYLAPPTLGQDTETVLCSLLGMSQSEVQALRAARVI